MLLSGCSISSLFGSNFGWIEAVNEEDQNQTQNGSNDNGRNSKNKIRAPVRDAVLFCQLSVNVSQQHGELEEVRHH